MQAVRRTIDALIAAGLPFEDAPSGRRFDPAEVIHVLKLRGMAGAVDFWRTRYVATGRRMLAEAAGAGDVTTPPALAGLAPRRFDVEIRRSFGDGPRGTRLRLPLPVEDAYLRALRVQPILPPEAHGYGISPGRLEVHVPRSADATVTIGARLSFTACAGKPYKVNAPGNERPAWLAPSEGPIQVTPRVRALADVLAAGETEPLACVRTFHDHLLDRFTCGVMPYDRLGSLDVGFALDTGWFDCRLGAALLVALCRARAIPARLVGGYLLWRAPTEHHWAEAWIQGQGWTAFDLLAWDLSASGADATWRDVLFGAIDYRMKTQRMPHIFTGAPGVTMGPAWHRLVRASPGGTETRYVTIPEGNLIYSETIRLCTGVGITG